MPNDPLSQLSDLHLPAQVPAWPWAWGWYVLCGCGLVLLLAVIGIAIRHYSRRHAQQRLQQQCEYLFAKRDVAAISVLLRRLLLAKYPRADIAALQGEAWLKRLQAELSSPENTQYTIKDFEWLLSAPYQSTPFPEEHWAPIETLLRVWINRYRH